MGVSFVRLASARRNALAMCLCAALTAGASAAPSKSQSSVSTGNLIPVTNCLDDGSDGTLRKAIDGAADGDTIDMRDLQCSLITLQNGALVSSVPSLAIQGPGVDALTIDGGNASRVLEGQAFDISDVSIAHGLDLSNGGGGCIHAGGDLSLTRAKVSACLTISSTSAPGGAILAVGNLTMHESVLAGNKASAFSDAGGGGALVIGTARLYDSTVSGNAAQGNHGDASGGGLMAISGSVILHHSKIADNIATSIDGRAYGGGIHAQGGAELSILDSSTVSGNTAHSDSAEGYGGGINSGTNGYAIPTPVGVERSTISGNTVESVGAGSSVSGGGVHSFDSIGAKYSTIVDNHALCADMSSCKATGGGLASFGAPSATSIMLINATISANTATGGTQFGGFGMGGGIQVGGNKPFVADSSTIAFNHASTSGGGISAASPTNAPSAMNSTIVASNDTDTGDNDISTGFFAPDLTIGGSNNLVMQSTAAVTLPADTRTVDPHLMPLTTDDGGITATHPLPPGSIAIDAGSNPDSLGCDQRGYPYRRVQGSAADIGAYEAQGEAHLFSDSFEVTTECPPATP